MRWTVHGERTLYDSEWVRLNLADVEVPSGRRYEHHVVRATAEASGVVVHDPQRGVLMLWRHRFITDSWGWEIPAGRLDPGENREEAVIRECVEETGYRPSDVRSLASYHPINGLSDTRFHLFAAPGAHRVGEPTDIDEAERVEWVRWDDVLGHIRHGRIGDGLSLTALLWYVAFEA